MGAGKQGEPLWGFSLPPDFFQAQPDFPEPDMTLLNPDATSFSGDCLLSAPPLFGPREGPQAEGTHAPESPFLSCTQGVGAGHRQLQVASRLLARGGPS